MSNESSILTRMRTAVCGLLLVGTAFAGAANAAEKVRVRLDYLPYGMHAPFYYALEKGWFAEKGLEVEMDDGNGGGPAIALVAGQKYDIAYASLGSMAIARDKGMPVKAIAAVARKGDFGVVADPSRGINTPRDLEGKSVLYSSGSFETPFIDVYLKRAGVDKSKVKLISVDLAAKVSTYMAGKADAMMTTIPLYTMKGVSPRDSIGLPYSAVGINVPSFGLVTHENTIETRPKMLADFVGVFQKSWLAIYRGGEVEPAVAALLKNRPNSKLDPAVMKAQVESFYPYLNTDASKGKPLLWMPPSDWVDGIAVLEELKLVKAKTDPEANYTNQFIPAE